jgi:excisionase family DNA binding protein
MSEPYINIDQAAAYLNVKVRWLYERSTKGKMPVHRLGRHLRYRVSELDAWVESGEPQAV